MTASAATRLLEELRTSPTEDRLELLRALIPEAFSEGEIDWESLREALGDIDDGRPERYRFTWAGKRDAIRQLQRPATGTLVAAPEESVDFETSGHVFIEGENLEVLRILYKPYFGRVKMVYIDPPYNTGNDFIYPDDFKDPVERYLKMTGQRDTEGNDLTTNRETSGRYHSAWLSMMYPRLFLARQLLRDDGVIFVSIDDHEVHNLRMLMNEIFGEENFVANVIWQKKYARQNDATWFSTNHDHVLLFARNKDEWRPNSIARTADQLKGYSNPDQDPRGPWQSVVYTCNKTRAERPNLFYPISHPVTGEQIYPKESRVWGCDSARHQKHVEEGRVWWGVDGEKKKPRLKVYLEEVGEGIIPQTVWLRSDVGDNQDAKRIVMNLLPGVRFDSPKPPSLIQRMIQIATENDRQDIILDFFAGSGTTAQAVLDQNRNDGGNRRFVLAQLPESTGQDDYPTISDIAMERIRRVSGQMKEGTDRDGTLVEEPEDLGFKVFKLTESNFRTWPAEDDEAPPGGEDAIEQMDLLLDPLREGWKLEDVVFEIALREGFGFGTRVERVADIKELDVRRVTDPEREQDFFICLDDEVRLENLRPLALSRDDTFICRDAALDDETAANLALQCRLKTV